MTEVVSSQLLEEQANELAAPAPELEYIGTRELLSLPTLIAKDPGNGMAPSETFAWTAAETIQRLVSQGHKNYSYWRVNVAELLPLNLTNLSRQIYSGKFSTNNCYWNAVNKTGQRFGIVGEDFTIDSTLGPTLRQYVDISKPPGGPSGSKKAQCNSLPGRIPSCYIDSGGEERISVYLQFLDITGTKVYQITGGITLIYTDGTVALLFLINPSNPPNFHSDQLCACPVVSFPAIQDINWVETSPLSTNTVPGNYRPYGTLGAGWARAGTNALVLNQVIDPTYQFP